MLKQVLLIDFKNLSVQMAQSYVCSSQNIFEFVLQKNLLTLVKTLGVIEARLYLLRAFMSSTGVGVLYTKLAGLLYLFFICGVCYI